MTPAGVDQSARTSLVDCLLATVCAYFCWSGLFRTISGHVISMLGQIIEVGECIGLSDTDEHLFISAIVSTAAAVKCRLEKIQDVEFDEGDHNMIYAQALRSLKKFRDCVL